MQAYIVRYAAKNSAVFNHKQSNYSFIQGTRSSNLLVGLHRVGFEIPRLFFSNSQLLAGSRVNDVDKHRQTGLHIAAANNRASIISVLLENGVDPDATDEKGNNGIVLIFIFILKILIGLCLF